MERQELEKRLNDLLVGQSAYNMWTLCHLVEENAKKWLCDSQGFIGTRLSGYDITIVYMCRRLVSFTIKRKKDAVHGWVVKDVVLIDEGFKSTEERIEQVVDCLKKENSDLYYVNGVMRDNLKDMTELLRVAKETFKDKPLCEIKDIVEYLGNNFWNAEVNL